MRLIAYFVFLTMVGLTAALDYYKYIDARDDFIDPLDPLAMLEAREKAAQQKEETVVPEVTKGTGTEPPDAGKESNTNLIRLEDCPVVTNCSEQESDEYTIDGRVYFRRYVHSLMRRFERRLPRDLRERVMSFNALISLDQADVTALRHFLQTDDENYQDVTEILSTMVKGVNLASTADMEQMDFDEIFGFNVDLILKCVAILASVAVLTLAMTRVRFTLRSLGSAAIVLFFISVPWDWMQLYKKAVARRASEFSMSAPEHCTPVNERTWSGALRHWALTTWTFTDDPCTMYHEALVVDPILDVSPIEAFTATLTKFFVSPLQYIGAGLAKFFNELGKGLPSHYAFGVIVFIMAVFVLWLIMRMGYQIKLPFYGGLERAPTRPPTIERRQYRGVEDVERRRIAAPPKHPQRYPTYLPARDLDDYSSSSSSDEDVPDCDVIQRPPPSDARSAPVGATSSETVGVPEEPRQSLTPTPTQVRDVATPDATSYPSALVIGTRGEVALADSDGEGSDAALPDLDVDNTNDSQNELDTDRRERPEGTEHGAGDSFEVIPQENENGDYDIVQATELGPDLGPEVEVMPVTTLRPRPNESIEVDEDGRKF